MESIATRYIEVTPLAYTGPVHGSFTYESPVPLAIGQVVQVPIGRRQSWGVVTQVEVSKPGFATKPVAEVLEGIILPEHLMQLADWIGQYYAASAAAVWQALLPAGVQRKRRIPQPTEPVFSLPAQEHVLTPEQQAAFAAIQQADGGAFLVQGVTGSGKTRLYLELAAYQLKTGQSAIILVPEIALTPQLIALFEASFPGRVVAYHSAMTEAQKHLAWQRCLQTEQPLVVVGPRSSLFLPLPTLGLIVIDECHETSYKQEQAPRYHAIPTASKLAQLTGAKLVLGSATPSLNEVYLAQAGRIQLLKLTKRVPGRALPAATIINMRDPLQRGRHYYLSEPLLEALRQTLTAGRQSLLFLNRRGTASSQICEHCGHVSLCPTCHLPLTFHADTLQLICHLCNLRQTPAAICPECGAAELKFLGTGTKRIETEIARLLPDARLMRLDKDSADPKDMPALHQRLHAGEIDILIGTQMIAKGLDLPLVDTVGVINADSLLHLPDFSSAERSFQLIAQVAGRAGRGDAPGRVFIQTRTPDHPAITAAASGDFWSFATAELASRQAHGYPPFRYLLKLTVSHKDPAKAIGLAQQLHDKMKQESGLRLLGPAPAFHERAGGSYHWHLIIKAASRNRLLQLAADLPAGCKADLDPINLL
jgi:primosomal protein N' (replication factor Y)